MQGHIGCSRGQESQSLRGTPLARPRLLRTVALARRRDVEPSHSAEAFRRHLNGYLLGMSPQDLGPDLEVLLSRGDEAD